MRRVRVEKSGLDTDLFTMEMSDVCEVLEWKKMRRNSKQGNKDLGLRSFSI